MSQPSAPVNTPTSTPTPWFRSWRHVPRDLLRGLVSGYRLLLSPWIGNRCRFEPTCSRYALQALERHGALAGSALAAGRLLRCHPWCDGGCDPVPDRPFPLFSRWLATPAADSPEVADAGPVPASSGLSTPGHAPVAPSAAAAPPTSRA